MNENDKKLLILNLEDSEPDSELIEARLAEEGLDVSIVRVENEREFISALEETGFDLILADYSLPSFDGLSALKIGLDKRPEIPFIFVSGAIGEDSAVDLLKSGATDFVLKNRISRLVPAVKRALEAARDRAERKRLESEKEQLIFQLQKALANVRKLTGLLPICMHCKKIRDDKGYWNQLESYISEHSEAMFSHGLCPECMKKHYP
ncbi:MAG: response regulator [Nitrospiraceae bacterium]|nr:response regulator [Nitrospiraceae bacterium]